MPRFAMKVAYDGAPYSGFQIQDNVRSVQGELEKAVAKLDQNEPRVVGSGRTDTGVHAIGQVVHVDLERNWEPFRLAEAMNFHLRPNPIAICAAALVDDEFSARFSAIKRRYLYRILVRRAPQTYGRGTAWWVRHPLDARLMHKAAQAFIGQHDFTTFRSSMCQAASPIKTVDRVDVEAIDTIEGLEIQIHVEARSFMHNQVRSFVGTLERVGAGRWEIDDVRAALEAKDRSRCGPVAPAEGLYFAEVEYPIDIFENGFVDG